MGLIATYRKLNRVRRDALEGAFWHTISSAYLAIYWYHRFYQIDSWTGPNMAVIMAIILSFSAMKLSIWPIGNHFDSNRSFLIVEQFNKLFKVDKSFYHPQHDNPFFMMNTQYVFGVWALCFPLYMTLIYYQGADGTAISIVVNFIMTLIAAMHGVTHAEYQLSYFTNLKQTALEYYTLKTNGSSYRGTEKN